MIETIKKKLAGCRRSLTIWFNGAMVALAMYLPAIQDSLPQLQAYLPANAYQALLLVVLLGNIALRFKTVADLATK